MVISFSKYRQSFRHIIVVVELIVLKQNRKYPWSMMTMLMLLTIITYRSCHVTWSTCTNLFLWRYERFCVRIWLQPKCIILLLLLFNITENRKDVNRFRKTKKNTRLWNRFWDAHAHKGTKVEMKLSNRVNLLMSRVCKCKFHISIIKASLVPGVTVPQSLGFYRCGYVLLPSVLLFIIYWMLGRGCTVRHCCTTILNGRGSAKETVNGGREHILV